MNGSLLEARLRRWADARERRNPFGHGKTGTALLREAADEIQGLKVALERQQEIWSLQSRVIRALAEEVPDDVRTRILAPIREMRNGE